VALCLLFPFANGVLSALADYRFVVIYVDNSKLLQLVVSKGLTIFESVPSHLADLVTENLTELLVAFKKDFFDLLIFIINMVGFDSKFVIIVVDNDVIGYVLMSRQHFDSIERFSHFQRNFFDCVDPVKYKASKVWINSSDLVIRAQLANRNPQLVEILCENEYSD
jgi:hypothetical protein